MRTALIYLCTADSISAPLLASWCGQRVAAENIPVTQIVTDTDKLLPRADRPGWQRVMALVEAGGIVMVVTLDRTMLAVGRKDWDGLAATVAAHGAVLPVPSFPPTDGVQPLAPTPATPPVVELADAGAQR
ncbi:hypothetical protein [Kitasatospora cineracea]|uniref:hypothetical protein n=1 Tax=Kitasatospora cineracea TaxID=88074 RepID=UPI00382D2313